jgi:hypothetical protein
MIKYLNGQPVEHGDIVHVRNHAYYVRDIYNTLDIITLSKMNETKDQVNVKLSDIGAYRDNVHPLFKNILEAVKP